MLHKAEAQFLSAWLNFASGSVSWEQPITYEVEDGNALVLPFHELISQAEALLLDPESTSKEYEQAKDYAEAINLLDEDSTQCEFDDTGKSSEGIEIDSEDDNNKGKTKTN